MKVVIAERLRSFVAGKLPAAVEPAFFKGAEELQERIVDAEAGWFDFAGFQSVRPAIEVAGKLKWFSTMIAGVGHLPLDLFAAKGITLTNGAGVNAIPVAEYAIMGMFVLAKNFPAVLKIQESRQWPMTSPGVGELFETKALIVGYGAIGHEIGQRLRALGVEVTGVRRSGANGADIIGPDDWRPRLGEFDWVILAAPATTETEHLMGAAEIAAMKPSAFLLNIARGSVVDQAALIEAVDAGSIAGAFLDVTEPEPAPPEDPVWSTPGIIMTCHLSGRSQTRLPERGAKLFLENLENYVAGRPLKNVVDLERGY